MRPDHTPLKFLPRARNAFIVGAFHDTSDMLTQMNPRPFLPALALALLVSTSDPAKAQPTTSSPVSVADARNATRDELEVAAIQFDRLASSTAYSDALRAKARAKATAVRSRLTDGDFRVGDQLILRVEGSVAVSDTVTVLDGRRINVRGIRQVSLDGVLRSELEHKLLSDLTEVVRNATVTARPLMRVAVFGSVLQPGFISVPRGITVDRVIMQAGGPAAVADMDKTTLVRGDTVLMRYDDLRLAIVAGTTLDQLGVQDGDALVVPQRGAPWDRGSVLQLVSLFMFPLLTIFGVFSR